MIKAGLRPETVLPSITAGLLIGVMEVVVAISFAALIFSDELGPFVSNGIGLALFGSTVTSILVALMTSLPGIVSMIQDAPTAIAAVVAGSIVVSMPAATTPEETFTTVVAFIAISTLLTGVVFLGLGYFKLGNLVRFLPFPVVGGFLAGTGWLLVLGGLGMLIDKQLSSLELIDLFQADMLVRWIPGLLVAVIIMLVSNRWEHYLAMPVTILLSVVLFYLVALIGGVAVSDLSEQGWLLGPFPDEGLWKPVLYTNFENINWPILIRQAAGAATITLVSAVSLLLNSSGLELSSGEDIDFNRELQAAGTGNALASFAAGLVGYQGISLSVMNIKLQASSRLVGLIVAAICGLVLIIGGSFLSYFPKIILGGILLYLGLAFLVDWLYEKYSLLPKIDYFIVIFILLVVAFVGFLEAVAVGILLAVVLFVVGYSRVDVIKHRLSGSTYRSRVTRPLDQRTILQREGERIFILQLQGFIFFGTAESLLKTVRQRLEDTSLSKVNFVILDFRQVTGLDSTAVLRFERMKQLTEARKVQLVITGAGADIRRGLESCGFCEDDQIAIQFASLDRGIEWCEDRLLKEQGVDPHGHSKPLLDQLATILPGAENLDVLASFFEREEIAPGEYLIKQGEQSDCLYFIEHGQLTAQLEIRGRRPVRLETMGSGRVVGELGFYLGQDRTAAIVANKPSIVYRLTTANLRRMEQSEPLAASTLHRIVIHLLSERVTHLVKAVNALEQ